MAETYAPAGADDLSDRSSPLRFTLPPVHQFADAMGRYGVGPGVRVILYDRFVNMWAARIWWMLRAFGFDGAAVLNGGWKKWTQEGRPTHSGKVMPKPGKFTAKLDPGYIRSQQQVLGNIETRAEQLVDARPRGRFEGTVAEPRPESRSGHIPGSRNVPYAELFDAKTGTMKPLEDLRQAFGNAGVDLTKPIVTSCGSGVSALVLTLALYRLGVRGSALYDGSWAEWGLPDGPPIATGPA